jgi:sugar phosphate isomerase/epimerase
MNPLSLNGLCTSLPLDGDLALASSLDIPLVCVPVAKRAPAPSGVSSAVLHPSAFTLADPSGWDSQRAALMSTVDYAASLRAPCVYLTTGPGWPGVWEESARSFAAAIAPVVAYAEAREVCLALENTNPLRTDIGIVHTLRDALDLALDTGLDVCVDLYACWYERGLRDTFRRAAGRIALVQVSDFVPGTLDTPNRAVPGDGAIPLARLLGWLLEDGYAGPLDLELLGPRIAAEGVPAALARAAAYLTTLLGTAADPRTPC